MTAVLQLAGAGAPPRTPVHTLIGAASGGDDAVLLALVPHLDSESRSLAHSALRGGAAAPSIDDVLTRIGGGWVDDALKGLGLLL